MKNILIFIMVISMFVLGGCAAIDGGIPGIGSGMAEGGSNSAAAYFTTSEVGISSYSITEDDLVTLVLRNNMASTITIQKVRVSETDFIQDICMAAGEKRTINFDSSEDLCANAGDSFAEAVEITYTYDDTGTEYIFTGDGNRLEGICVN